MLHYLYNLLSNFHFFIFYEIEMSFLLMRTNLTLSTSKNWRSTSVINLIDLVLIGLRLTNEVGYLYINLSL